jgi:hypothetical protein
MRRRIHRCVIAFFHNCESANTPRYPQEGIAGASAQGSNADRDRMTRSVSPDPAQPGSRTPPILLDDEDDLAPDAGCLAQREDDLPNPPGYHEQEAVRTPERSPSPSPPHSRAPTPNGEDNDGPPPGEQNELPEISFDDLPEPSIHDLQVAMAYIRLLKQSTHANSKLPDDILTRIMAPFEDEFDLDDPNHRQSVMIFLATLDGSRQAYDRQCVAVTWRNPEHRLLSYAQVQRRLAAWTGVHLIRHDMCYRSCVGFTGPNSAAQNCPNCGQARYNEDGSPRKQFYTLPVVTQVQARYASPVRARQMKYGARKLRENLANARANGDATTTFSDVLSGAAFLERYANGTIRDTDIMLFFSTDGAQLYRNKASNCWFSIACILNLPPDLRYKKTDILPLCIIPGGEHEPKDMDSFNFPVFEQMAALMRDGFRIWDAETRTTFHAYLHLCIAGADQVGLTTLDGGVGHKGRRSCRLKCPYGGRRKPGGPRYYPVLQCPHEYDVAGSAHPDEPAERIAAYEPDEQQYLRDLADVLRARPGDEYEKARLRTGIVKPTIFLGFPADRILGVLGSFCIDIMHLLAINAPETLIPLWRGTFAHDKRDKEARRGKDWPWAEKLSQEDHWARHGQKIRFATPYLPGWYDRTPRNPAEKINSGYKAWEYMLYLYGLGPMDFRSYLPFDYWRHFCMLVRIVELCGQDEITAQELQECDDLIRQWCVQFEELYVKRDAARLHMVRPWIHTLLHIVNQTASKGPPAYYSQWTMERVIGFLEDNMALDSSPYANLAMIATRQCQINALKSMVPDIVPEQRTIYDIGIDLGHGYASAHPREPHRHSVEPAEAEALNDTLLLNGLEGDELWQTKHSLIRFGRLALPNGSIARTRWKESLKPLEHLRTARMVEVCHLPHSRLSGRV